MPPKAIFTVKKDVHWGNSDIAELQKVTIAAHRRYEYTSCRMNMANNALAFENYNHVKKQLRATIWKAQENSLRALYNSVDNDFWGVPLKLVIKRIGHRLSAMDDVVKTQIARGFSSSTNHRLGF